MKKKDNRSLTVLLKVIITIVAFIIGYGGYLLFEKLNVKMVDASYENLHFKVASNYKQKSELSGVKYSTGNGQCTLKVEKNIKMEFYNPNTQELDDKSYKIEDLYSDNVELIPKMINGKEWFYHESDDNYFKKIYYYDYIIKNVRYHVAIYSKNDNSCHVNDIANSLELYLQS